VKATRSSSRSFDTTPKRVAVAGARSDKNLAVRFVEIHDGQISIITTPSRGSFKTAREVVAVTVASTPSAL